jgi:RNA polymerase sigma factor (sigma-70 family)
VILPPGETVAKPAVGTSTAYLAPLELADWGSTADTQDWFQRQVHAHDATLKAHLRRSFPGLRDVEDVVQESYLRIWRARARQPIESARAFLFQVARRVALDLVRKERNSPVAAVSEVVYLRAVTEAPSAVDAVSLREKVKLLADALVALPPRSRQIVMLCKFEGRLRREVADELGISEKTVDEHLWRGIRRIEDFLRRRGVAGCEDP